MPFSYRLLAHWPHSRHKIQAGLHQTPRFHEYSTRAESASVLVPPLEPISPQTGQSSISSHQVKYLENTYHFLCPGNPF